MNTLYYGDNLKVLREHIKDASVDLIYLDPPFNSNRNYNILFKDESGKEAEAQITAFEDTWHWSLATEETYQEIYVSGAPVGQMIAALRQSIGTNQMMAYLVMMAARLVELHRVLKPTGSLYLHCDPTASHYLKIILDSVFGGQFFRSEITWKRTSAHSSARRFGPVHDVILFYTKSNDYTWVSQYETFESSYLSSHYSNEDNTGRAFTLSDLTGSGTRNGETGKIWRGFDPTAKGRHWSVPPSELDRLDAEGRIYWPSKKGGWPRLKRFLETQAGVPVQDVWTSIAPVNAQAAERLGYPTQKPLALLERIVNASSNVGDVVLDPFCGCGTTIAAAQKLGRQWIGIDVTHLSIALQKYRLKDSFGLEEKKDYRVIGEPEDLASARQLATEDRYQFQWWALSLVKARPLGGDGRTGKKGSDKGIDGVIAFLEAGTGKPQRILIQVKSGKVKSGDIRDLRGVVERENAAIGVFVTLEPPSRDMNKESVEAGFYRLPGWEQNFPKLQILTIEQLLAGAAIQMPASATASDLTFKTAGKVASESEKKQRGLF